MHWIPDLGLAQAVDPFVASTAFPNRCAALFGRRIDVLLHAGTHRSDEVHVGSVCVLNPGSAVLPADGAVPTFLRLKVGREGCYGQVIWVA